MSESFDFEYLPQVLYGQRPVRNSFFAHLGRAARALDMAFTESARRSGVPLTYDQFMLLVTVRENPAATQKELADNLCRDRAAVTHALSALVRDGWLEKHVSKGDRRKSIYVPTAKAMEVWESLGTVAWGVTEQAGQGIAEGDMVRCINSLVKIFCNLRPEQQIYISREKNGG